jgi:hypothetical protein
MFSSKAGRVLEKGSWISKTFRKELSFSFQKERRQENAQFVLDLQKPRVSCQDRDPILQEIYCRYGNPMITLKKIQRKGAPFKESIKNMHYKQ